MTKGKYVAICAVVGLGRYKRGSVNGQFTEHILLLYLDTRGARE